jgi:hypothetical protein
MRDVPRRHDGAEPSEARAAAADYTYTRSRRGGIPVTREDNFAACLACLAEITSIRALYARRDEEILREMRQRGASVQDAQAVMAVRAERLADSERLVWRHLIIATTPADA